ncbi:hypothetical protein [Modestobacter sp. VKM Ac-2984]|uniref:hypothetical protein n=1 Tax=Modestobacter sp. VKM Ac-2984 TaxID=3004138 RepID=UPI0022AAD0E2|nr:hypothetical protein [Modestobacter sp. VKM Ac-2984]MCZ2818022.1 hypothetical protein [Modestobacter sp. VKM Ac-2984]
MPDLTFRDLTTMQAQALLAAHQDIVNPVAEVTSTPEEIIAWVVENATELQAGMLNAIAAGSPDWVPATELGEKTGLNYAQMGGTMSRLHLKVVHRYGPEVNYPWEREEKADIVRYRVTESVAAIILDSGNQPTA